MNNLSVLDADACVYILSWKYQDVGIGEMQAHVSQWVENILSATQAHYYLGFVGGVGNFRKEVAKSRPYKGTRKEDPESIQYWKPIIKSFLVNHWGFVECHGIEADDACSIAHTLYSQDYSLTICGCDHDLLQLSGNHFNYQKGAMTTVTPDQASHNFWLQMLTGCQGDCVPALPRWGVVKGEKALAAQLNECKVWEERDTYREMKVQDLYFKHAPVEGDWVKYYKEQYTLLKLLEDGTPHGFTCPSPTPVLTTSYQPVEANISHLFV